jgi:RNase P subunit RPR2
LHAQIYQKKGKRVSQKRNLLIKREWNDFSGQKCIHTLSTGKKSCGNGRKKGYRKPAQILKCGRTVQNGRAEQRRNDKWLR